MQGDADVTCIKLRDPENGQVHVDTSGMVLGSVANYCCDSGYNLVGSVVRMCTAEGTWSGEDPICQRKPLPTCHHGNKQFEPHCSNIHPIHFCV